MSIATADPSDPNLLLVAVDSLRMTRARDVIQSDDGDGTDGSDGDGSDGDSDGGDISSIARL